MSVASHVTPRFPSAFITVGNADPLESHSELLAQRLQESGVDVETLFFGADYQPPLGHEFQFDLDSDAGCLALERITGFVRRRTAQED
jgi:acetyl esterase/lipase